MVNREDVALYNVDNAINNYVTKMSKDDLEKYVRWNMKDYYQNVADEDEAIDFCISARDTSVCIKEEDGEAIAYAQLEEYLKKLRRNGDINT